MNEPRNEAGAPASATPATSSARTAPAAATASPNRAAPPGTPSPAPAAHADSPASAPMPLTHSGTTPQARSPGAAQPLPAAAAAPAAMPPLLREARREELLSEFLAQYRPEGPTETTIVADLANRAVAIEQTAACAAAIQRETVAGLLTFAVAGPALSRDALLAGAAGAEALDRCDRRGLGHARAFYRALARLEELQARRRAGGAALATSTPRFTSEAACVEYLADSFRSGRRGCRRRGCRRCGATEGWPLAGRAVWECGACGAQTALRDGTVMARSPLPLMSWFEAVRLVLGRPTIPAVELAAELGIARVGTAAAMARRIRRTLLDDDASDRLAGLDSYYASGATDDLQQVSCVQHPGTTRTTGTPPRDRRRKPLN